MAPFGQKEHITRSVDIHTAVFIMAFWAKARGAGHGLH